MAKDIFWTDLQQANERLLHSVVMYDGAPVYVNAILAGGDFPDGDHRALVVTCDPKREEVRKKLNSPKFKRFRDLPKTGWFNAVGRTQGAVYLARRAITTRTHGLNNNNVQVSMFRGRDDQNNPLIWTGGDYNFQHFIYDEGFANLQTGKYPSLEATLNNIVESSAIAISDKWCVMRDARGIRWLYRNLECVGLFTGTDTLNLLTRHAYLREEVMEDATFTINTIREF